MSVARRALLMAVCLCASASCLAWGGARPEAPAAPDFEPPDLPVLHSFRQPGGEFFHGLGFTADGRILYTWSPEDSRCRQWGVDTGKALDRLDRPLEFPGCGGCVVFAGYGAASAFSPDGRVIAAVCLMAPGMHDQYVVLLDAVTGKLLQKFSCYRGVDWLAFSPDGAALAVGQGNAEGIVKLWDIAAGKAAWESQAHGPLNRDHSTLWGVYAPDGRTIAAEFADGSVSLFDAATGKEAVLQPAPTNVGGRHHQLAYSPDGRFLATTLRGVGEVYLWNVGSRKPARLIDLNPRPVPYTFHLFRSRYGLRAVAFGGETVAFSPDGRTLLVWGSRDRVRLFEVASGKLRGEVAFQGEAVVFSPTETLAAMGTSGGAVYVCDWRGPSRPSQLAPGEAERLWDDLASEDGVSSWKAVLALSAAPQQAAAMLRRRLRRRAPIPAEELDRLTAQLDDDDFEKREKAERRLAALGEAAGPALRRALGKGASPEQARRVEELLKPLGQPPDAKALRKLRAVEALEYAGSAEAHDLLNEWASGAEGVLLTEEACAALGRVNHKHSPTDP